MMGRESCRRNSVRPKDPRNLRRFRGTCRKSVSSMKILLTNDDGIEAAGLAALAEAAREIGRVTIAAPHEHLSGCSHQVTSGRPLEVRRLADDRHAVYGTPADCTRLGLLHLAPESEWVMAGVNDGGNLGVDVHMSGTVAAVREAALLGRPGIAFSQYHRGGEAVDWALTSRMLRQVLRMLIERPLPPGAFWNVNFPHLEDASPEPAVVFCPLEAGHLPVEYEFRDGRFHYAGAYHRRPRQPGGDVDVCFSGQVAVTQMHAHPTGRLEG